MAIVFKKNGVITASAPIMWRFVGHSTIWFSFPANFENNVVVKCHYLKLPKNTKVEILNGEVTGSSRVAKKKDIVPEKITNADEFVGFTTTLAPELNDIPSDSVPTQERRVPETPTTTIGVPHKRKVNR
jgi:hypothetical protein